MEGTPCHIGRLVGVGESRLTWTALDYHQHGPGGATNSRNAPAIGAVQAWRKAERREAYLSTQHPKAGQNTRLSQAHVDAGRTGHLEVTAAQGAPPSHRLSASCLPGRLEEYKAALRSISCSVPGPGRAAVQSGRPLPRPPRAPKVYFPRWDMQLGSRAVMRWSETRSGAACAPRPGTWPPRCRGAPTCFAWTPPRRAVTTQSSRPRSKRHCGGPVSPGRCGHE